ncbi:MAG: AbrB/MazE/SpoVT family DNA-binding domain-containing protein [Candidatus Hydrothermarchaeota archaeon]|nr:MAG: AbrB/MazE/SpoVT family DNA-binding domain-containing protein [Candidatus Hydrothermarchaeota archaeon]
METKISKGFQVVVPSIIRNKFGIKEGDSLIWELHDDIIIIRPKKKKTIESIVGIVSVEADAVELKKKAQRGRL